MARTPLGNQSAREMPNEVIVMSGDRNGGSSNSRAATALASAASKLPRVGGENAWPQQAHSGS